MADVMVEGLRRSIGPTVILDGISLSVNEGEFVTLLGPSGCGKSTTLNLLAGLDRANAGRILVGGQVLFDGEAGIFVEPQFRNLGMMFQSYALWPHMTVWQNLAFPLDIRGITGAAAREKITQALDLVEMGDYAGRYPGELSGGQQQRVALARTLVYGPRLLLLDEPLSNLDAKLRDKARGWLRDLQKRMGVTTIYVTHDQTEALALSDRIVVMEAGRIVQVGAPEEIYMHPATPFVADFVGANNLFEARILREETDGVVLGLAGGAELRGPTAAGIGPGQKVLVAIRPEQIAIGDAAIHGDIAEAREAEILDCVYQGSRYVISFRLGEVTLHTEHATPLPPGKVMRVVLPRSAIRIFRGDQGAGNLAD